MKFQMLIQMNDDGTIGLQGPLGNKPLCKALLAGASELVDGYQAEEKQVVPVVAMPRIPINGR